MPEYFTLMFSVERKDFVLSRTELCLSGLSGCGLGDPVQGCSSVPYKGLFPVPSELWPNNLQRRINS